TGVSSAAAEILGKRVPDIGLARLFVFREESRRLHDHAVDAVAALDGLFVDERLLHRVGLGRRAEPLERDDLLPGFDRADRRDAGAHGRAVDVDGAGAALPEAAAEARPVQPEVAA